MCGIIAGGIEASLRRLAHYDYWRALTGINPTPVTVEEARKNLVEETADVYNVMGLLLDAADNAEIYSIIRRKKERWLKRLEG